MPSTKLHDTVVKLFNNSSQDDAILKSIFVDRLLEDNNFQINFNAETPENAVFGVEYFKHTRDINDVYLYPMGSFWYSPLYFNNNKPFLFSTSFAFKFKTINNEKSTLTVVDVNPVIVNGAKCCGMHLGNVSIEQKVQPTTVEEYTLILFIAKKLNVKGLQPLHIPR